MGVRKRMASLNASAVMAATYDVERHLDKHLEQMDTYARASEAEKEVTPKRIKDIKDEVVDSKDVNN